MTTPNQNAAVEVCTRKEPITESSLEKLARSIDKKQGEIENHANSMISLACDIGAQLDEAKSKMEHGKWRSWVAENISFGHKQAAKYLRLYNNRDFLAKGPSEGFLTSIDAAVTFISSEKKRLEAPDSVKTKSSPEAETPVEQYSVGDEGVEEFSLDEACDAAGEDRPKGTGKSEDISNVTSVVEDHDEPPDDTLLISKSRTKKTRTIEGEYTEVDSAPTKDVEETEKKTPTPVIDITNEKDIKTVLRALDPEGKPLTPRRLKTAHNAFKRLLEAGKHG